ncbi:MAG: DUF2975 domain-containing protein [Clostridia bacterium]|nr:DUF2975 domain-containing protein [Clostridia bacterium]
MWNSKKSIQLSLVLTYIFMGSLVIGIIALPWLVEWYVEVRHRSADLPTTIMLTCYPCVPFAAVCLWSLKVFLQNLLQDKVFNPQNATMLLRISWCCFGIMAIMLFSGRYYLPFYICAICTAFLGLILRVIRNLIQSAIQPENLELNEDA